MKSKTGCTVQIKSGSNHLSFGRFSATVLLSTVLWAAPTRAATFVDPTFNTTVGVGNSGFVESVVVQPEAHILICGNFTTFNGANKPYIARLNADGSLDSSFNAAVSDWVRH